MDMQDVGMRRSAVGGMDGIGPQIRVLTRPLEVEELKPAWQKLLEAQGPPATTFQTPDWILALMRYLFIEKANTAVRIVVVEQQHDLVLVAPLAIVVRNSVRVLQWLGEPLSAYGDIVARRDCDVALIMNKVVERLQRAGDHIDVVHLPKTRADAAITPFLKSFTTVPFAQKRAPYLDLSSFSTFEAYLATRSTSAIKSYRRKRRRLAEVGQLTFQIHPAGARAEELGRYALELKIKWMKTHGKVSRLFADDACLNSLLEFLRKEGSDAVVSELSVDDRPVALEIGFITNRHYYSYIGAMDLEFSRFSPGQLQLLDTLRWCFENGIEIFDLLPSDSPYKRAWSTDLADENEWIASCSLKGAIYKNVVLKGIIPLSRRLYSRAPLAMRKPAQSLVQGVLKG